MQHRFAGIGAIQTVVEQIRELAKVKNNTLRYECDKDFSVYADYDRFVQILVNITKNANQFTDNGEILVKAWNEGKKAIVEISDTGIGIDESEIKRNLGTFLQSRRFKKEHEVRRKRPWPCDCEVACG